MPVTVSLSCPIRYEVQDPGAVIRIGGMFVLIAKVLHTLMLVDNSPVLSLDSCEYAVEYQLPGDLFSLFLREVN